LVSRIAELDDDIVDDIRGPRIADEREVECMNLLVPMTVWKRDD
jgi:hypothetical protein